MKRPVWWHKRPILRGAIKGAVVMAVLAVIAVGATALFQAIASLPKVERAFAVLGLFIVGGAGFGAFVAYVRERS